jgi:hypothetical protein
MSIAKKPIKNPNDLKEISEHELGSSVSWQSFTPNTTHDDAVRIFVMKYGVEPRYVFYSKFGNMVVAGPTPGKENTKLVKSVKHLKDIAKGE